VFAEDAVVLSGHCAPITHCQLLPQQRVITSSVDGNIMMWDGRNGRVMYRIPVGASVTSLHATPRHIIAGLGDGRVAVWSNPESPKKLPRLMLSFTGHPAPVRLQSHSTHEFNTCKYCMTGRQACALTLTF
jgi:WD40 repeat protein